jgi:hypothetical protein
MSGDVDAVDVSGRTTSACRGRRRADEVDAHVEQVAAVAHLVALPSRPRPSQFSSWSSRFELPRAVRVRALGDDEVAEVLADVLGADEAGELRLGDEVVASAVADRARRDEQFMCSGSVRSNRRRC